MNSMFVNLVVRLVPAIAWLAAAGLLVVAVWWGVVLRKRRRKSRFAVYGHQLNTFQLRHDGEVRYAQWLHPKETPKILRQEDVTALRRFVSTT